ncbi:hypothetical protein PM082_024231 [Marasmius tenuissimus]|nr:hypothetical protein PM082_024231 [Marasmius tenuissimus]
MRWREVDCFRRFIVDSIQRRKSSLPLIRGAVSISDQLRAVDYLLREQQLEDAAPLLDLFTIRHIGSYDRTLGSFSLGNYFRNLVIELGPSSSLEASFITLGSSCAVADTIEALAYQYQLDFESSNPDTPLSSDHFRMNTIEPIRCQKVLEPGICLCSEDGIYPHLRDIFRSLTLPAMEKLYLAPLISSLRGNGRAESFVVCLTGPNLGLKFLELRAHKRFDSDQEYVNMIRSRWRSRSPESDKLNTSTFNSDWRSLRTATLDILGREADELVYQPLKVCDREGMQIVVKAGGEIIV